MTSDVLTAEQLAESAMTLSQAAKYLRISKDMLYRMAERGETSGHKTNRGWLFTKTGIDNWLASGMPKNGCDLSSVTVKADPDNWRLYYLVRGIIHSCLIGTVDEYPTEQLALAAAEPIRKHLRANEWIALEQEPTSLDPGRFNYTSDEYQAQLVKQSGKCAICGEEPPRLHWDHDHDTGDPRELLCSGCNKALGLLRDDSRRCERAAAYLRRFGK